MKPRLVHNWPHVKEENDELSSRILNLANDYSHELEERKKQNNENTDTNNFSRFTPIDNKDNITELKPVMSEEENLCNLNFFSLIKLIKN